MDTALILAGVIIAAAGVGTTVVIWVLRGIFNLGGLNAKVDALTEKVDDLGGLHAKVDGLGDRVGAVSERVGVLAERVEDLSGLHTKVDVLGDRVGALSEKVGVLVEKVDEQAEGQKRLESKVDAMQADLHRAINMMTALANHRHDVDGNTIFNVPPNP